MEAVAEISAHRRGRSAPAAPLSADSGAKPQGYADSALRYRDFAHQLGRAFEQGTQIFERIWKRLQK